MKYAIVAIRDIKTDSYFPPQFVRSIGGFLRQLADDLGTPQPGTLAETMSKHPGDFEVYHLGDWDDQNGTFDTTDNKQLCVVSNLKV